MNLPDNYISDMLGWYVLAHEGGFKIDMDVLFVKSIPYDNLINIDVSLFKYHGVCPVGFLFGTPNKFWQNCWESAKKCQSSNYQSLGPDLLTEMVRWDANKSIAYKNINIQLLSNKIAYPYVDDAKNWDDNCTKPFIEPSTGALPEQCIAIHWYAGHPEARKYNEIITHNNIHIFQNTIAIKIKDMLQRNSQTPLI